MKAERGAVDWVVMTMVEGLGNVAVMGAVADMLRYCSLQDMPRLFPGHTERDCKGVPCFRCRGFGHTAWDCKGIPYCGGGGWNFSSSGGWVGQPPIQ
ncbi:hypothetical protein RHMOL_Rhmol03G0041300 [Rhododendron molle]|uniref:Uncharacterized protein n=1 Tax=Rhododendron molle TaxID=49168 RepID=A0ACC0PA50_RHOML|nr:hypothetical protein RHMOL_Rhmol03G0041300 [Rhododendron molle]